MAAKGAFTLVVEDRFGALTDEYTFDSGELVVGRSRQSDIVLSSENVSRRHARIWTAASGLVVEDLQSANGTYVNGQRISGATELADQDVVRLGDFHLHVHGGKQARDERPVYLRLVGLNLTVAEQVFEITSTTTLVGRGKDCGLVLVDPSISRVHARIIVRPDGTVLAEDVGSANGVSINGKRVKVWQLAGGDRLKFGNVEFLVEIPSANTQETMAGSGLYRLARRVGQNLPWVVATACAVVVLVLLAVFVPDHLRKEPKAAAPEVAPAAVETVAAQAPAADPVARAPGGEAAAPAAPDRLATARKALSDGKIDDAAREVATVIGGDPANAAAVQLLNRIEAERAAGRAVAEADQAVAAKRFEDAVASLLRVPPDSVYREQTKGWLVRLIPEIDRLGKKACSSGKTVDCVRLKALAGKIEKAL